MTTTQPPRPPKLLTLLLIIVALAIFGVIGARYMLKTHAANTQEQLALVWPHIASMPEPDRAFLTELALTCNVSARQPAQAEVVDCLRSVAGDARSETMARLERLLGQGQR